MLSMAALLLIVGCRFPAREGGFDSVHPSARLSAIERAARQGDRTALPRIVESLDADDPLERFLAIQSLERLTGTTLGYDHAAPRSDREDAVVRWLAFARSEDLAP